MSAITAPTEIPISHNARKAFVLIAVCFTLSGAAGLIYEVLWMRMLGLVFGATTVAISVVLTAFMGGLALVSAIGGKVAARFGNALRAYGVIEIAIGFCAICLPLIFRSVDALDATVWRRIHPGGLLFSFLRFVMVAAVLLIPTMLMGATLPTIVMQIIWSRLLAMIIGSSTYAFALVLALFLLGLALGAWIVSLTVTADPYRLRSVVFLVELFTVVALFMSFRITNTVPEMLVSIGFRFGINSWAALLSLQALAAMILILVPATLMGMIMPIVLTWAGQASASSVARTVGQVYALNTLGAIAGALVTTFVLMRMASSTFAAFCMAAISLGVAAAAFQSRRSAWDVTLVRSLSIGIGAVLMIAMVFVWPRL